MIPLTWLYVPADRPDRIPKALASGADVVVIDLEDAVAPAHKDAARMALPDLLAGVETGSQHAVEIRINGVGSHWYEPDCRMVCALPPQVSVRVPKVEDTAGVSDVVGRVGQREVTVLLESARAVENAAQIAAAHPQVRAIGLGEADLRSDLGIEGEDGLAWVRARLVVAARAAGLPRPAMSVYPNVHDLAGLARSCELGRSLGMRGRAAIHPRQLDTIRAAFVPTARELGRAQAILEAIADAATADSGVVRLADGTFLDRAMVQQARDVVELGAQSEGA